MLFEAKAFHSLRKVYEEAELKTEWARDARNPERLDALAYAQTIFKDDREARDWMRSQSIEPAIIEAALNLSFTDFIRLSTKALRKILPPMEIGQRYDEAVQSAGYAHHSQLHASEIKKPRVPPISRNDFPTPSSTAPSIKLANWSTPSSTNTVRLRLCISSWLGTSADPGMNASESRESKRDLRS